MSRLQTEFRRLFVPATADPAAPNPPLVDGEGRVRALVLELLAPLDGQRLGAVWAAAQNELDLPAPLIAVSGDGMQLWFSLAEPVDAARGAAFVDALRARHLGGLRPDQLRLWPPADPAADAAARPAPTPPPAPLAPTADGERWSAFVAADLAPLFAATPWLDIAPGDDSQAALLAAAASATPAAFDAALAKLATASAKPAAGIAPASPQPPSGAGAVPDTAPRLAGAPRDPRGFLLAVMNDESVPLALRVDAAKALLNDPAARRDSAAT